MARIAIINEKTYTSCKQCPHYKKEDGVEFCGEGGFEIVDSSEIDWECLNKERVDELEEYDEEYDGDSWNDDPDEDEDEEEEE